MTFLNAQISWILEPLLKVQVFNFVLFLRTLSRSGSFHAFNLNLLKEISAMFWQVSPDWTKRFTHV